MKFTLLPITVLILGLAACNNQESGSPSAPEKPEMGTETKNLNIPLSEFAVNKDLYCGMPLQAESIGDTANYEGKLYGFCATECKTEFLKNPQAYLTQK